MVESLLPLLADSPDPRLVVGAIITVDSRREDQRRAKSDRKSDIALEWLSLRDFVDADLTPESADDSRLFLIPPTSVVEDLAQGNERAKSANVSRLINCESVKIVNLKLKLYYSTKIYDEVLGFSC